VGVIKGVQEYTQRTAGAAKNEAAQTCARKAQSKVARRLHPACLIKGHKRDQAGHAQEVGKQGVLPQVHSTKSAYRSGAHGHLPTAALDVHGQGRQQVRWAGERQC